MCALYQYESSRLCFSAYKSAYSVPQLPRNFLALFFVFYNKFLKCVSQYGKLITEHCYSLHGSRRKTVYMQSTPKPKVLGEQRSDRISSALVRAQDLQHEDDLRAS